jgi:hypothetical protein
MPDVATECEGYKDIGYMFTFLSEFGCLLEIESAASEPQYCIGFVGSSINAFNVNRTVSLELCHVLAQTGCCYQSFIDVELPAIAMNIVETDAIAFLRNLSISCSELDTPLATQPCQGGATDVCQLPFDEIAFNCLDFALDFPQAIFQAMQSQEASEALCAHKCYNSSVKLAQMLVANRTSLSLQRAAFNRVQIVMCSRP